MLDLDTLLNYYTGVSRIPLCREEDGARLEGRVARFYTRELPVPPGEAAYCITDEFLVCGKLTARSSGAVILLGPVTDYPLSWDAVHRVAREMELPSAQVPALRAGLAAIPQMPISDFLHHLGFLNYVINENNALSPRHVHRKAVEPRRAIRSAEPVRHNTAQFENEIVHCVEYGRTDLLEEALRQGATMEMEMGDVADNSLDAVRTLFGSAAAIACRAAIRGGLDYHRALTLADSYHRQVGQINNLEDSYRLLAEMLMDLTRRVDELRVPEGCSPRVREAIRSINGSIESRISVARLAGGLGISSAYLSRLFKQETGRTLTEYIAEQKIWEARRLMQTTDLTLAQIAFRLSFSSQSYFHATFKKVTGVNPGRYPRSRAGAGTPLPPPREGPQPIGT